jgi:hypothetical protein
VIVLLLIFLLVSSIVLSRPTPSIVLFIVLGEGAAAGFTRGRVAMRAQASGRQSKARLAALEAQGAAVQRSLCEAASLRKQDSTSARNGDSRSRPA